uniref:PH domain-containing protein n=1 Tax=Rhabditophanes sp. KR3021 TaxID=114890 RepID=A0AC35U7F9_9BILA
MDQSIVPRNVSRESYYVENENEDTKTKNTFSTEVFSRDLGNDTIEEVSKTILEKMVVRTIVGSNHHSHESNDNRRFSSSASFRKKKGTEIGSGSELSDHHEHLQAIHTPVEPQTLECIEILITGTEDHYFTATVIESPYVNYYTPIHSSHGHRTFWGLNSSDASQSTHHHLKPKIDNTETETFDFYSDITVFNSPTYRKTTLDQVTAKKIDGKMAKVREKNNRRQTGVITLQGLEFFPTTSDENDNLTNTEIYSSFREGHGEHDNHHLNVSSMLEGHLVETHLHRDNFQENVEENMHESHHHNSHASHDDEHAHSSNAYHSTSIFDEIKQDTRDVLDIAREALGKSHGYSSTSSLDDSSVVTTSDYDVHENTPTQYAHTDNSYKHQDARIKLSYIEEEHEHEHEEVTKEAESYFKINTQIEHEIQSSISSQQLSESHSNVEETMSEGSRYSSVFKTPSPTPSTPKPTFESINHFTPATFETIACVTSPDMYNSFSYKAYDVKTETVVEEEHHEVSNHYSDNHLTTEQHNLAKNSHEDVDNVASSNHTPNYEFHYGQSSNSEIDHGTDKIAENKSDQENSYTLTNTVNPGAYLENQSYSTGATSYDFGFGVSAKETMYGETEVQLELSSESTSHEKETREHYDDVQSPDTTASSIPSHHEVGEIVCESDLSEGEVEQEKRYQHSHFENSLNVLPTVSEEETSKMSSSFEVIEHISHQAKEDHIHESLKDDTFTAFAEKVCKSPHYEEHDDYSSLSDFESELDVEHPGQKEEILPTLEIPSNVNKFADELIKTSTEAAYEHINKVDDSPEITKAIKYSEYREVIEKIEETSSVFVKNTTHESSYNSSNFYNDHAITNEAKKTKKFDADNVNETVFEIDAISPLPMHKSSEFLHKIPLIVESSNKFQEVKSRTFSESSIYKDADASSSIGKPLTFNTYEYENRYGKETVPKVVYNTPLKYQEVETKSVHHVNEEKPKITHIEKKEDIYTSIFKHEEFTNQTQVEPTVHEYEEIKSASPMVEPPPVPAPVYPYGDEFDHQNHEPISHSTTNAVHYKNEFDHQKHETIHNRTPSPAKKEHNYEGVGQKIEEFNKITFESISQDNHIHHHDNSIKTPEPLPPVENNESAEYILDDFGNKYKVIEKTTIIKEYYKVKDESKSKAVFESSNKSAHHHGRSKSSDVYLDSIDRQSRKSDHYNLPIDTGRTQSSLSADWQKNRSSSQEGYLKKSKSSHYQSNSLAKKHPTVSQSSIYRSSGSIRVVDSHHYRSSSQNHYSNLGESYDNQDHKTFNYGSNTIRQEHEPHRRIETHIEPIPIKTVSFSPVNVVHHEHHIHHEEKPVVPARKIAPSVEVADNNYKSVFANSSINTFTSKYEKITKSPSPSNFDEIRPISRESVIKTTIVNKTNLDSPQPQQIKHVEPKRVGSFTEGKGYPKPVPISVCEDYDELIKFKTSNTSTQSSFFNKRSQKTEKVPPALPTSKTPDMSSPYSKLTFNGPAKYERSQNRFCDKTEGQPEKKNYLSSKIYSDYAQENSTNKTEPFQTVKLRPLKSQGSVASSTEESLDDFRNSKVFKHIHSSNTSRNSDRENRKSNYLQDQHAKYSTQETIYDSSKHFGRLSISSDRSTIKLEGSIPLIRPDLFRSVMPHLRDSSTSSVNSDFCNELLNKGEHSVLHNWDPVKLIDSLYEVNYEARKESKRNRFSNMEGLFCILLINIAGHLEVPNLDLNLIPELEKNWKPKYFKTKEGRLTWYASHYDDKNPEGDISLAGTDMEYDKNEGTFYIHGGREKAKVTLRAPLDLFDKWKQALISHSASSILDAYVQPVAKHISHSTENVVILELGSCSIRGGILTKEPSLPQSFFPAVGCIKNDGSIVVGHEAYSPHNRHNGILHQPIPNTDPAVEKYKINKTVLRACIDKVISDLKIDPTKYKVLLSLAQNIPPILFGDILTMLLRDGYFSGVSITRQPSLILYSYDVTTGVVVDIGERLNIVPVIDGYIVDNAVVNLPYGALQICESLRNKLHETNKGFYSFQGPVENLILRHVMEQTCYIAQDYDEEVKKTGDNESAYEVQVSLDSFNPTPDMHTNFVVNSSRFVATEGLFKPKKWGIEGKGLHQLINDVVQLSPIDSRRTLFKNIYLSGGTSLLPELAERLENEITKLVPPTIHVQVHMSPWRYHAAYLGAQVLASSCQFDSSCISKNELSNFINQLQNSAF